jgi:hypothetical protein
MVDFLVTFFRSLYATRTQQSPLQVLEDFKILDTSENYIKLIYCPEHSGLPHTLPMVQRLCELYTQRNGEHPVLRRYVQDVVLMHVEEIITYSAASNDDTNDDPHTEWKANVKYIMQLFNNTAPFGSQYPVVNIIIWTNTLILWEISHTTPESPYIISTS